MCILSNLKNTDDSLRCLYKSACITEAMTDGTTCGTKAIWTDGWRDEWTDRWMEEWRKVDRVDKWRKDECCSPPLHYKDCLTVNAFEKTTQCFQRNGGQHRAQRTAESPVWWCIAADFRTVLRFLTVANVLWFSGPLQRGQVRCSVCNKCQWWLA